MRASYHDSLEISIQLGKLPCNVIWCAIAMIHSQMASVSNGQKFADETAARALPHVYGFRRFVHLARHGHQGWDRILGFVKLWILDLMKPTTNASLHRLVPRTRRDQAELLTSNLTFWPGIEPLMSLDDLQIRLKAAFNFMTQRTHPPFRGGILPLLEHFAATMLLLCLDWTNKECPHLHIWSFKTETSEAFYHNETHLTHKIKLFVVSLYN